MEQVIKSKLRVEAENIDQILKQNARCCAHEILKKREAEKKPKYIDPDDLFREIAKSAPVLPFISIVEVWIKHVSKELNQAPIWTKLYLTGVVWNRFVSRVALSPWLIQRPSDQEKEQKFGLKLLNVFMRSCKDVVYSHFTYEEKETFPKLEGLQMKEFPKEIKKQIIKSTEPIRFKPTKPPEEYFESSKAPPSGMVFKLTRQVGAQPATKQERKHRKPREKESESEDDLY